MELNEVLEAIDTSKESDLELDDDRHMEVVPIDKEIPSQLNEFESLADHFARLNTQLDSIDARLISYGE